MRDIHGRINAVELLGPAVYTDDNVPIPVDLADFEAAEIVLQVGVGGITFTSLNKIEFKLTHSDNGTDYSAVGSADLVGAPAVGSGGIILTLAAAHAATTIHQYGYIGGKRYLKLLADFGGTHATGTALSATLVKGRPHYAS